MSPALRRALVRLHDERWVIVLVLVALVIRLHWNLVVHPPGDFVYSDMRGYMSRADGMFEDLWGRWEYNAFYPFGTHVFLYGVRALFGQENFEAVATVYAVLGALEVGFGYALARRVSRFSWVPPLVGLILLVYYPLIALGGYFLSEVPFSFCLVASTFFLVRMCDDGRPVDAVLAGIFAALGFTVRPQILLSIALFGILWFFIRRAMPRLRFSLLLWAFLPLLLMIGFSAWRMHYHTGRWGLISENGKFNQVFGRCHNEKIVAMPDTPERRRTSFGPPPLIQLKKRSDKLPGQWPQLDPAIGELLQYKGYIGDQEILGDYIEECVKKTGLAKQVEYSFVNAVLLWRYNIMWPDSGKGFWRDYSQKWGIIHTNTFAVPALVALLFVFVPRRHPRHAIVSLHVWSIILVALAYIGGVRFRSPYDPFIVLLAVEVYAMAGTAAWRWGRARMSPAPASPAPETAAGPPGSNGLPQASEPAGTAEDLPLEGSATPDKDDP